MGKSNFAMGIFTDKMATETGFDGEIESQTNVTPLSSPTCDLFSVLRVNRDKVEKIKLVFLVIFYHFQPNSDQKNTNS